MATSIDVNAHVSAYFLFKVGGYHRDTYPSRYRSNLCTYLLHPNFWRLFCDLFGWPENLFHQTNFCFRCKNLFCWDVLGFFGNDRKQRICLSPPAGPKIYSINLFSVHKLER